MDALGINHIENRATRASDGFVEDNFPDRSETNLALIANASIVFAYSSNALVGVNLKHYTPTNNGIVGISLGGYVLFLY